MKYDTQFLTSLSHCTCQKTLKRIIKMATDNSVTKNQKTNIIVIPGNDETLQNLVSIIQKTENCDGLADITRHVVSVFKSDLYGISYKVIFSRSLNLRKTKHKCHTNVVKLI